MTDIAQRNLVAQWAFDTRPVLQRFHLWLENVEVERAQSEPVSDHAFTPREITRCLALTSAATALGTRLFGQYGAGRGLDKQGYNQVKKAADAISAYIMSEGLWYLTRALPENHAIMVCLGEGLMPKAGETPEMGANPLLGFGRVYARPQVARFVDAAVRRLLNDPEPRFREFYDALRGHRITLWGAAVDTLENTSRFAEGQPTGPMTVLHLFDSPLTVTRPYEAYFGSLTVPRELVHEAERRSVLLDWATPRAQVLALARAAYPDLEPGNVHVWTLAGKSRATRLGRLWEEWRALGVHLVEEGWVAPSGLPVFTDSGTYAPTFLVGSWRDPAGTRHLFLCDGYAATAEAMQAASLSEALGLDTTMTVLSPTFRFPHDEEYALMRDVPESTGLIGERPDRDELLAHYREAVATAARSNVPMGQRVLRAADFLPEKRWEVLAALGYICTDPYTGTPGVEQLDELRYRVTASLRTRSAASRVTFTLRLKESLEEARLVFSPLLVRFLSGTDWRQRAVKISDSGRLRNELQTLVSQALEFRGERIRVHFDRIDEKVMPRASQETIRQVLTWYKEQHPIWFDWLELS
ncbi:MAG TPA: hypothetical protein PKX99_01985 [Thermoanaerobaculia bacterium]|nr:hypothetical protein [Thermoanaerobaculia bacterium]